MSSAAFYNGGMDASLISEIKHLQAENARLKRMYADLATQNELVKGSHRKKVMRPSIAGRVLRSNVPRGLRGEPLSECTIHLPASGWPNMQLMSVA